MAHGEEARKVIGDLSRENIDLLVRPTGLSEQLEEASAHLGRIISLKYATNEASSRSEDISIRN